MTVGGLFCIMLACLIGGIVGFVLLMRVLFSGKGDIILAGLLCALVVCCIILFILAAGGAADLMNSGAPSPTISDLYKEADKLTSEATTEVNSTGLEMTKLEQWEDEENQYTIFQVEDCYMMEIINKETKERQVHPISKKEETP